MNKEPITVCIRCATYNHENYLAACLDSFVMQKTNFRYVAVVHDDCSADGTTDILREYAAKYPNIIIPMYEEENQYSKGDGSVDRIIEEAVAATGCKYIAICEGDDYWTDPLKLQKQVDFLEGHEEYSMCFHRAKILCEGKMQGKNLHSIECEKVEEREYESTELFTHWVVPTASILYRKEIDQLKTLHCEWLTAGDIDLVLKCANQGKVWGMSNTMSIYRVQENGLTQGAQYKTALAMRHPLHYKCLYINYPKLDKDSITWVIAASYYTRMRTRKDVLGKIGDCICMFYWNPRCAITKISDIINRKIKK